MMADRVEAATLLLAGAITGGEVTAEGADPGAMDAVLEKIGESGADVSLLPGGVRVRRDGPIRPVNVETSPYPGFPTDVQAQFMAYMCLGDGSSIIRETIFENRFMHVAELRRMGALIDISGNAPSSRESRGFPAPRAWRRICGRRPPWCWRVWPGPGPPRFSGSTTWTGGTRS